MFNDDVEMYVTRGADCQPGSEFFVFNSGMIRGVDHVHYRWHPNYVCWHILSRGRGVVRAGGREHALRPGDMFSLWPDVEIEYFEDADDPWNVYFIHLLGPGAVKLGNACGFGTDQCFVRPDDPAAVIREFRAVMELLRNGDAGQEYLVCAHVLRICWMCRRGRPAEPDARSAEEILVERAKLLIESRLDRNININELAGDLRVGRTTLHYAFSRVMGCAPGEYLRRYKLEQAKRLLSERQLPLEKIARMSGFTDSHYLGKLLRRGDCKQS